MSINTILSKIVGIADGGENTASEMRSVLTDITQTLSGSSSISNVSELINDSGYITGYSVTQPDVTQYQTALSITESQILDLGNYQDLLISGTNIKTVDGNSLLGVGDIITTDTIYDDIAIQAEVNLNTAKTGITPQQSSDITTNNAKTGITPQQSSDITTNNAKTGITPQQSSDITINNAKIGITPQQSSDITINNAKIGITPTQASNIATNNTKVSNVTHTGNVTGSSVLTIANGVVTNARLANVSTATLKDRQAAGTGAPTDLSISQVKTMLALNNVPNTDFTTAVGLNTAKIGITAQQSSDITTNNAKISYTDGAFIDQDVTSGSAPIFDASNFTNLPASGSDSLSLASTNVTNSNVLVTHIGGMNDVDSATPITLTILPFATEPILTGSTIVYNQIGAGTATVAYAAGASGDAAQTFVEGDTLTLWHKTLNNWVVLNPPKDLSTAGETNTINSILTNEPSGSDVVPNVVSLTQAEYNAGTPVVGTHYIITDAPAPNGGALAATVGEVNIGIDNTVFVSPLGLADSQLQTDVTANNTKISYTDSALIDQDVTSGSAPIFDASNFTNLPSSSGSSVSSGIVLTSGGNTELSGAITTLGNNGVIYIQGGITLTSNITIPSGITLVVNGNGLINNVASVMTFDGHLEAGQYKIFENEVVFNEGSVETVKAEWFGLSDYCVREALKSAGKIPVTLNTDITMNNQAFLQNNQTIHLGKSIITTGVLPSGGSFNNKGLFENADLIGGNSNITITGGVFIGTSEVLEIYCAVRLINVTKGLVKDIDITDITLRPWVEESGAIRIDNCTFTTVDNVKVTRGWRMGVYFFKGSHNRLLNSYFFQTQDSGFGGINCEYMEVDNNEANNCGRSGGVDNGVGASNMTASLRNSRFTNNISRGARGTTNSNGFTLGHPNVGEPLGAFNNLIDGNFIFDCDTKGIVIQGDDSADNIISNNIIINCGLLNTNLNNGGIAILDGTNTKISGNTIKGCYQGVSLNNGAQETYVSDNVIKNSTVSAIRNDAQDSSIVNNQFTTNTANIVEQGNATNPYYVNKNVVKSDIINEPTGSDVALNIVTLTQAEYDAGTPVATTIYIITA